MSEMTNHTESLEEILGRLGIERNTDFNDWSVEDHHWTAILADPAILAHIPAYAALREENERLKHILAPIGESLERAEAAGRNVHEWIDYAKALEADAGVAAAAEFQRLRTKNKDIESKLAALQGGEAVAELVDIQDGLGTKVLEFLVDRNTIPIGTKLYTTPQPAIAAPAVKQEVAEFNINHNVYVRLTEAGHAHIEKKHFELFSDKVPFSPTKEDADGWSKWQLWDLMQTLGEACFMGGNVPFETTIWLETPSAQIAEQASQVEQDAALWRFVKSKCGIFGGYWQVQIPAQFRPRSGATVAEWNASLEEAFVSEITTAMLATPKASAESGG